MKQLPATPKSSDEQLALLIGNLLRTGVLTAAIVVMLGGLVYLIRHGEALPNYNVFHGEPSDLCSASGIIQNALAGSSRGAIQLGLLLLIATPVMRVVLSLIGFARQRDWVYVFVTLTVLLLLLYSLFDGLV